MKCGSIILIGAGGHAKVLLEALVASNIMVRGVVDPELVSEIGASWRGVEILGGDEVVFEHSPSSVCLVNGVGSIPGSHWNVRARLYERFDKAGYKFGTVIHPFSAVSSNAKLSSGVQIMAGAVVQADVAIGQNTLINTRASVDHDCEIGEHCHIAPGVTVCGGVKIGNGVHVGTGASIIQGVILGENCMIGAGTTVRKNVLAGTTFLGH